MRVQPNLFIGLAFLMGLALSVFFVMLAKHKAVWWPYLVPVAFSIATNAALAVLYQRTFDIMGTALLAIALAVLAILIVRFEVIGRK